MIIREIAFTPTDNGYRPEKITATFSLEQALWMASIAEKLPPCSESRDIHAILTSYVFTYWENGLKEALQENPIEITER